MLYPVDLKQDTQWTHYLDIPSMHITSFQRCNNVVDVRTTLYQHAKRHCVFTGICAYLVYPINVFVVYLVLSRITVFVVVAIG